MDVNAALGLSGLILLLVGEISTFVLVPWTQKEENPEPEENPKEKPSKKKKNAKDPPAPKKEEVSLLEEDGIFHRFTWGIWTAVLLVPWYTAMLAISPDWVLDTRILPHVMRHEVLWYTEAGISLTGFAWFSKRYTHYTLRGEILFFPLFAVLHLAGLVIIGKILSSTL